MLEAYVGADNFRNGVRAYMRKHPLGNTVDSNLWREIQAVAGKPVLNIEHDFTRQAGVPLVRVEPAGRESRLVAGQFAEDPDSLKGAPETRWHLPLAISASGHAPATIVLAGSALVQGTAPLVNAGGTAYARVATRLPRQLPWLIAWRRCRDGSADAYERRMGAWASGYAPAQNLMTYIANLPADADPVVWDRAVGLLVTVDRAYGHDPSQSNFRGRL